MTEKPRKQSYSLDVVPAGVLGFLSVGFFVFATIVNPSFFLPLCAGFLLIVFFLLPLSVRLKKNQSEVELQIQNLQERRNLVQAEIQEEQSAIHSFQEKIVNYAQLKGLTERLGMCLSLDETSKTLSEEVNRLFGGGERTVILYLLHSKTGELGISSTHKGEMCVNIKSKNGDLFDQWVVRTMQPLLVEDIKSDYRFDVDRIGTEENRTVRSLISIPMAVGHKTLGILRIDSPREKDFHTEDLRFLSTIGDLGAVAIENGQLYERVEQLAVKDGLTGLYLRRYLLERIPEEISRQLRHKGQLSFLMFDLDKFKQYNDRFGHTAGDIVLRAISMMLGDFFKEPGNLVCRYGGEEFSVLLPDCTKQRAVELAEEIREKIADQTIILRRKKTNITVSIGVAAFPQDASNVKELIHKADLAMYAAKENGRNRVGSA